MPVVRITRHLQKFFPHLPSTGFEVDGSTAAELIRSLDDLYPGIAGYLVDEQGSLRKHVNVFIDGEMAMDRAKLSDSAEKAKEVVIMQALSGG